MRKIEPKMVEWIDAKLASNGLAQEAIAMKDARTLFVCAAEACVGIREKTGRNDGPMVELIQETVGGHSGESWCMSFMQTCIAYAEHKTGIESPLAADELCWNVWTKTPVKYRVRKIPKRGAIAIWNYRPGTKGHTGVVLEYLHKPGKIALVEGNTERGLKEDGTIESNGGGCYFTERPVNGTKKMVLLGFLKPF